MVQAKSYADSAGRADLNEARHEARSIRRRSAELRLRARDLVRQSRTQREALKATAALLRRSR
ncbi:hypothetical protein [Streptomyces sp. NPDC016845]|uniref:hypothetical protein n=1 Tax=Streptomyces sp. NPDC016845 TaxID=3364972 RepID=UPI00379B5138